MEKTLPMILQWDESFDIGSDTLTVVNDADYKPFTLTAKLNKLTVKVDRPQLSPADIKKLQEACWRRQRPTDRGEARRASVPETIGTPPHAGGRFFGDGCHLGEADGQKPIAASGDCAAVQLPLYAAGGDTRRHFSPPFACHSSDS